MNHYYDKNSVYFKRFAMYTTSIIIFATMSWWIWCVFSFNLFSSNREKGLYSNGPIKDFKDGSMEALFHWMKRYSITLVIFYAPWSAQSIKQVPVFLAVRNKISSSLISVAAINCWVGTCREKFPTHYFPRVFLYHTSHSPIEYIDDFETNLIIQFVYKSLSPWIHIGNLEQLDTFMSYDNYLISYMNPSWIKNDKIYDIFYSSSLMIINRMNKPHIGVVTNATIASLLQLTHHGQIKCHPHTQNIYYSKSNYTVDNVSDWMMNQSKAVVSTLKPALDNGFYIKQLKQGPAMILPHFTGENHVAKLYQDVALYYMNGCKKSANLRPNNLQNGNICTLFLSGQRLCSICQHCLVGSGCGDRTYFHFQKRKNLSSHGTICSSSVSIFSYFNSVFSDCCLDVDIESGNTCMVVDDIKMLKMRKIYDKQFTLENVSLSLEYLQRHVNIGKKINVYQSQHEQDKLNKVTMINQVITLDDGKSKEFMDFPHQNVCKELDNDKILAEIKGLACRTNQTLNFFTLSHNKFEYLLKNIGVIEKPQLIIIDLLKDEHYILNEKISRRSIATFIWKYTKGYLQQNYLSSTRDNTVAGKSSLRIIELTAFTFEKVASAPADDNFVMFYASWCGVCKSINLLFLKLSHSYSDVVFSRIDADIYMLPWQFKPPVYPSFILFPAGRAEYSVHFPHDQQITLQNLSHFLNTHLGK